MDVLVPQVVVEGFRQIPITPTGHVLQVRDSARERAREREKNISNILFKYELHYVLPLILVFLIALFSWFN